MAVYYGNYTRPKRDCLETLRYHYVVILFKLYRSKDESGDALKPTLACTLCCLTKYEASIFDLSLTISIGAVPQYDGISPGYEHLERRSSILCMVFIHDFIMI